MVQYDIKLILVILQTHIGSGEEWTYSSKTVMLKLSYINEIQKRNNLVSMPQGISFPARKFHCKE
jgi:hypothetical protein